MIKILLLNRYFSPLGGDLNLDKLLRDYQEEVLLSCDEPRNRIGGDLERATAEYLSTLLPHEYVAKWDESTEGYHMQQNDSKELPARIDELRFKVLLQKTE